MSQRNNRIIEMRSQEEISGVNNKYCNRYTSGKDSKATVKGCQYDSFIKHIAEKAAKESLVVSENGALEYATTGSSLTDFNARATEFRNADKDVIVDAAIKAFAEDPVQFVKLVFQTGDIRGGKGERHSFNTCMDWLVAMHPCIADEILSYIPEFTRWDYLIRLTVSDNDLISNHATELVTKQFLKDIEAVKNAREGDNVNISLLAKWMPSLQTKKTDQKVWVRHLLKSLHLQEREYRHILSKLRGFLNVIEKHMSSKDYDSINLENMTSKQQLRYSSFLKRVMEQRRHEYIQAVLRGEKKMNASVLNPLEIWHEYAKSYTYNGIEYNEDNEALWSLLPDKTSGNGNTLVIRDGSGSMTRPIGQGSSATMLEAASAMAVYCADHLSGVFKDKFITFSSRPEIVDMSNCKTLVEKMTLLYRYNDCSNTNLEATFDLILGAAVENGLSQDEIPSYMMILSDMEFDAARGFWRGDSLQSRKTLFSIIRAKWEKAGYQMPTLVFWHLNGTRTIYPEIDSENGIIFLSGFSTNELELVMAGEYERVEEITEEVEVVDEETGEMTVKTVTHKERVILSPMEQLELKLSNPRYDVVEAAVKRGIERECA